MYQTVSKVHGTPRKISCQNCKYLHKFYSFYANLCIISQINKLVNIKMCKFLSFYYENYHKKILNFVYFSIYRRPK